MFHRISNYTKHITVLGFTAIVLVTIIQVIARYIFNAPIVWGEELSRYIFVWVVMLASGIGIYEGAHLSLSLFTKRLNRTQKIILFIISQSILILFLFVIIVYGFSLTIQNTTILSSALKIPMSIPYGAIPVGGMVMLFYNLVAAKKEFELIRKN